ncbi:EamA-like transporter family protein [Pseudonocardiaceae bacterium YIM PH 21723]|nr:EamA-like transporter family protein [Pseudonocardiaceae bacterium YIM PH 21723]
MTTLAAPPKTGSGLKTPALIVGVLGGLGMAVQSRINGELAHRIGDGFTGAAISFGSGLVILLVVVLGQRSGRRAMATLGTALRDGELRFWQFLGGMSGGFLVLSQSLTIGVLGVAVFTVAVVAGQTGSGLLVDRLGLGPAGKHHVTWPRLLGAGLTFLAVLVSVSDRFGTAGALGWAVLPLIAGLAMSWQQAVNGRVSVQSGSPLAAALVNFIAGTALLAVFFLGHALFAGVPDSLPGQWWLYIGGAIGIGFIATAAWAVRILGVLLLAMSAICGQLLGAIALDLLFPINGGLHAASVIGAALTFGAVAVTALVRPRASREGRMSPS